MMQLQTKLQRIGQGGYILCPIAISIVQGHLMTQNKVLAIRLSR